MSEQIILEQGFLPSSSTMAITAICPGMNAMQQRLHHEGMLLDLDTPAANRGSEGHLAIAGEEYDEEAVEEASVDEANSLETSIYNDWLERIGDMPIGPVVREERIWGHQGLQPIFSAKPDVRVSSEDYSHALVIDHKLGWKEVPAPEVNLQIWTQVAALSMQPAGAGDIWADISQPLIHKHPRLTLFNGVMLATVRNNIKRISLTAIYHPKLVSGPHCGYCPARTGCMKGIDWANRMKLFAENITERVATLDPVKSSTAYEGLGSAIKVLVGAKKMMVERRRQDVSFMPNHKWVSGRRSVDETSRAMDLLESEGIDRSELESTTKFTIGELQKLIQRHFKISSDQAKERLGGILDSLIKTGQPSLRQKNSKDT